MSGEERREKIVELLASGTKPIPGVALAKQFDVSRQVIVQDIALIITSCKRNEYFFDEPGISDTERFGQKPCVQSCSLG